MNTPGALDAIHEFSRRSDLLVGAGTVLEISEAAAAVEAGARFLVSPVCDPKIINWCVEHGVVAIPGTFTPTEMLTAHRAGAAIVKFFPGPSDGPATVRIIRGPLPFLRIFPTSGVTLENAAAFLDAGAFGLGFVNCLFEGDDLAAGRFEGFWELKLRPWDVAAGLLIVDEAGGRTSDLRDGPAPRSGQSVVASNGLLHDALLALLDGDTPR